MCTLVFAYQVFEAEIVAATNRDERLDRPAEPPAVRDWESRVLAPKDIEAEGTWLGVNEHGVFVALTNRWADREGERSRGLLVRDALCYESADAATRFVERELATDAYAGCNLVVADKASALLVEFDGTTTVRPLRSGVHVVVNVGADGDYTVPPERESAGRQQAENANAVRAALQPEPGETDREWLDRAAAVIADHEYGVCVHGDGFGTRSSTLLSVGPDGTTMEYADGPPCSTPYDHRMQL
ncbi:NRDE family protein [Halovenus marina]|uniref:NRDE family protein n=1 Tax=Halovenus marina TaxID=3396621 RepID=UPI003F55B85B